MSTASRIFICRQSGLTKVGLEFGGRAKAQTDWLSTLERAVSAGAVFPCAENGCVAGPGAKVGGQREGAGREDGEEYDGRPHFQC